MTMKNNLMYQNQEQDRRIEVLEKHISTLNEEMGAIKTDVGWLKWWTQLTAGAAISSLVVGLINLLK